MKKHSKKKANQQFFEQIEDNKINLSNTLKIFLAIKAKFKTKRKMIYEYDDIFKSKLPLRYILDIN